MAGRSLFLGFPQPILGRPWAVQLIMCNLPTRESLCSRFCAMWTFLSNPWVVADHWCLRLLLIAVDRLMNGWIESQGQALLPIQVKYLDWGSISTKTLDLWEELLFPLIEVLGDLHSWPELWCGNWSALWVQFRGLRGVGVDPAWLSIVGVRLIQ